MNSLLTEIICVVDRSGSMEGMKHDAIGGFNSFLASQKAVEGRANLTLVLFDHEYSLIHDNVPLECVASLDDSTFVPRGRTALLDAIGRTLGQAEARHAKTPKAERPDAVIFCILTDGEENASHSYSKPDLLARIVHQQAEHDWQFVFLAANQDAIAEGASLGIASDRSVHFDASQQGLAMAFEAMDSMACLARHS